MNRFFLVIITLVSFCSIGYSQYRIEIGGAYGGNSYLGDGNPSYPFLQVQDQYGGLARVLISPRYALKFSALYGTMNGSTKYSSNILPGFANYAFSRNYWDIGVHLEYNFFPLSNAEMGEFYDFTPYIFTGFGITTLFGGANGVVNAPHLPFGGGVKWKPLEFLTLGAEIGMRKMFTDELDTYNTGDVLNNPYNFETSTLINNDYYLCFGIFAAISIFKHRWNCGSVGYH